MAAPSDSSFMENPGFWQLPIVGDGCSGPVRSLSTCIPRAALSFRLCLLVKISRLEQRKGHGGLSITDSVMPQRSAKIRERENKTPFGSPFLPPEHRRLWTRPLTSPAVVTMSMLI